MSPLQALEQAELTGVGLTEIDELAALQTRVDRKYILPAHGAAATLAGLTGTGARVLEINGERALRYASLYYDTPELSSYRSAAHGRRRRFKVRVRTYVDSDTSYLEVKTRGGRSATVKDRAPLASRFLDEDARLEVAETLAAAGIADAAPIAQSLRPVMETRYRRTTLLIAETDGTHSRATIDTALEWLDLAGERFTLPDTVIVETKSGRGAGTVDRMLWARRHRPTSVSKYATGLAAARPDLAANKWHRVLHTHFSPARAAAPVAA